jgi:hypothetical protein
MEEETLPPSDILFDDMQELFFFLPDLFLLKKRHRQLL